MNKKLFLTASWVSMHIQLLFNSYLSLEHFFFSCQKKTEEGRTRNNTVTAVITVEKNIPKMDLH